MFASAARERMCVEGFLPSRCGLIRPAHLITHGQRVFKRRDAVHFMGCDVVNGGRMRWRGAVSISFA